MARIPAAARSLPDRFYAAVRRPRVVLFMLAAWCGLAVLAQLFVNSGIFLDVGGQELDGALGGLALSFNAAPLALLYLYAARDPERYYQVFWLSLVHQSGMAVGNLYHWAIGTFSFESVAVAIFGAGFLAALSFLQVFEPKPAPKNAAAPDAG